MNNIRKFFSGYTIFCICWAITSLGLSVFSFLVRIIRHSNFNPVSSIKILPGINAGTFIIISSIYFLIAAILGRRENKNGKNMVLTSVLASVLFICQSLVVIVMYSIHKINMRIYVQEIVSIPFFILPLSIMMSELPHMRRAVSHDSGKRLFNTLDKITTKKDISRIFKPRGARKHK